MLPVPWGADRRMETHMAQLGSHGSHMTSSVKVQPETPLLVNPDYTAVILRRACVLSMQGQQ